MRRIVRHQSGDGRANGAAAQWSVKLHRKARVELRIHVARAPGRASPPRYRVVASPSGSRRELASGLATVAIGRVMTTDFGVLAPEHRIGRVAEAATESFQDDFPVLGDGHLVGVLTRSGLLQALASRPSATTVREVMETAFVTAEAAEPLEQVRRRLLTCPCRTVLVTEGRALLGLVVMDRVCELAAFRERAQA